MRDALPVRVRFGDFELDLRAGELRQGERTILLQEQPFRLLLMLVDRCGEIATREEIQKKLWPNDTVVEFDKSITAAIKRLRKTLGDTAEQPRYIETVARRGYRLMVTVERVTVGADGSSDSTPLKSPTQTKEAWIGHSHAASLTGKTVSHYRVLEIVGGGGMGVVYRAEDLKLGRAVAVKFLPEELGDDSQALERFEREARAASALDHPNICSIYEFGEHEGQPFIVMQLLEGRTLRDHLASFALQKSGSDAPAQKAFPLGQIIDVATQIANGLQAAHEHDIVHRDIKPANIFLTNQGLVKILDFGVAKLTKEESYQPSAVSLRATETLPEGAELSQPRMAGADLSLTRTGSAMGTAGYMSPEQVRGDKVDARTDLFSFGLVLYEMATGQRAFGGDTAAIIREAILTQSPPPAHEVNAAIPPKLEQIVNRAIEKDRERRYQSAAEMRADLKSAGDRSKESDDGKSRKRSRRNWLAAAAVVCVAMLAGGSYWYWRSHRPPKLTDKDTIVLADFDNSTGDPIFDRSLNQALSIELEQSPFLNVLSDEKVGKTLKLMNRSANERLTRNMAQEVCLRSNSRALLAGTIAAVGDHYLIVLRAANCQTGDTLASAEAEAEDRNHVLRALNEVGTRLRARLGESLASLQKFDQPLEEVTTPSLEALQAYTQGKDARSDQEAISYFNRAVELDPHFAIAYAALGSAYAYENGLRVKYLQRAYELRDRVSPRERFSIESTYYDTVTGETEKSIRTYSEWIQSYPDDYLPHIGLVGAYMTLGYYEKALDEAREAVRLVPGLESYNSLGYCYMDLNRLEDANTVLHTLQTLNRDAASVRQLQYFLAFLQGDAATMKELDKWGMGRPEYEAFGLMFQSSNELYHGHLGKAHELSQRAQESAARSGAREAVAIMRVVHAPGEAEIGATASARKAANDALALDPKGNQNVESPAALAFAMLGEVAKARSLVDQMNKESPLDTMVQTYILPTISASIELTLNRPREAIDTLTITTSHELGKTNVPPTGVYPAYVRGLAYLKLGQGQQAAVEFQKVLGNPGVVRLHLQGALAHLQLGRAKAMMGDKAAARTAYQDFLTLWKDADPDIPIYKKAKAEYAKLQ